MAKSFVCEVSNHPFDLTQADIDAYAKFGFEPLPICFPHQHQWRLAFRNDRFLHRRKCDLTGADIISMYPADSPYKVYEREAWFSDKWDPLMYGRPFDFNRPFFEQYADLQREVPRMALANVNPENSDYCNMCVGNKNCYLIFGGDNNEDCLYGALTMFSKNCADCDSTDHCELCYYSARSERCYQSRFIFNSKNCSDSAFLDDCIGVRECMLCTDLRNKSYCIENKQYSKEEYFERKAKLLDGTWTTQNLMWKRFLELRADRVVKYGHIINGENVIGDYIFNSKNCTDCFELIRCEDCHELILGIENKDCFNCDYIGHKSIMNYNTLSSFTSYNTVASYFTIDSSDIAYCEGVSASRNLFGCIGLRHQEHCILNKKYLPAEYKKMREKIVEHMKRTASPRRELIQKEWGKYFPKLLSPFPYNESTASYFFPLNKEQAQAEGFAWRDEKIQAKLQTYKIPDNIADVPDSILDETLACEKSGKNFRIIPQELALYRSQNIPIPRLHPDTRYYDRLALRNPFQLWNRACVKCRATVQTTYAPERPEKVYCEKCYLKEVY